MGTKGVPDIMTNWWTDRQSKNQPQPQPQPYSTPEPNA
jgi:hypothetical protein